MAMLDPADVPFSCDFRIGVLAVPIAKGMLPGRYRIISPKEKDGAL